MRNAPGAAEFVVAEQDRSGTGMEVKRHGWTIPDANTASVIASPRTTSFDCVQVKAAPAGAPTAQNKRGPPPYKPEGTLARFIGNCKLKIWRYTPAINCRPPSADTAARRIK